MTRVLVNNGIKISALIHCDLGRAEWKESLLQCEKQAEEYALPLHVLKRRDGLGLIEYIVRRMEKLQGTGKPFWPSSSARYCTSDLKREPSNTFFRNSGAGLIISAEGIRAEESKRRAKKQPLSVRSGVTSDYYSYISGYNSSGKAIRKYYSVEKCLEIYRPSKRLVLNWYPVFYMTISEVWAAYKMSEILLQQARSEYKQSGTVPIRARCWKYSSTFC